MRFVIGAQGDLEQLCDLDVLVDTRLLVQANSGAGKCHVGTDTVLLADGAVRPIATLTDEATVVALGSNLKLHVSSAAPVESFGHQQCYRISTATGFVVTVNEQHPLLTIDGWVAASDLRVGGFIATARSLPIEGQQPLPQWIPEFAGLMVGDGTCAGKSAGFTNADPGIQGLLRRVAEHYGWSVKPSRGTAWIYGAERGRFASETERSNPNGWLRWLGLRGLHSPDKRVPVPLFTAPNEQVARFLGCYFACDGTVASRRRGVEFYSVSRDLLADVKHLLLRFGIVSSLRRKMGRYGGRPHTSWRLSVDGEFARKFALAIPVPGDPWKVTVSGAWIDAVHRHEGLASGTHVLISPLVTQQEVSHA